MLRFRGFLFHEAVFSLAFHRRIATLAGAGNSDVIFASCLLLTLDARH
jgi:hypothetical protein